MKDHRFVKLVKSLEAFPEMMTKRKITLKSEDDKTILAGNYRYHALKKLGYKEIDEEWVDYADDWTEDQQQEFMLKDNIHMGEWDLDMLANEFDVDMLVQFGLEDFIPGGDEETEGKHPDSQYNDHNCQYPIIPEYDEKYEAVVVICRSMTELAAVKTKLNVPERATGYKNKFLGSTFVVEATDFI